MSPRVFVHLGPHKTASTYIQTRLLGNKHALYESGFYYPDPPTLGPGHAFIVNQLQVGNTDGITSVLNHPTLNKTIDIIISSENLVNLCTSQLDVLFRLLPSSSEIHLIYALRPALKQLKSLFQEKLKAGRPLKHHCVADWIDLLQSNDLSSMYLDRLITFARNNDAILHFLKIDQKDSPDPFFQFCECLGLAQGKIKKFNFVPDAQVGSNRSTQPLTQLSLSWINCFLADSSKSLDLTTRERVDLASLLLRGKTDAMIKYDQKDASLSALQKRFNEIAGLCIDPPPQVVSMCSVVDHSRFAIAEEYTLRKL